MSKMILRFIIAAVFVLTVYDVSFAMSCHGNDGHKEMAQAVHEHDTAEVSDAQKAENAGNKICPVSGEKIGGGMEPVTYEYKGKIYNFCCAMCIGQFERDPEKYIKKVGAELVTNSKNSI